MRVWPVWASAAAAAVASTMLLRLPSARGADVLGCAVSCSDVRLADGAPLQRVCEWEYRLAVDNADGLRNWVPVNMFPSTQAGTMSLDVQCARVFEDGAFPADQWS